VLAECAVKTFPIGYSPIPPLALVPPEFGLSLPVVYFVWVGVILMLSILYVSGTGIQETAQVGLVLVS